MVFFRKEKKILVVRFRGIGDFLLTLPALQLMKKQHPRWIIDYLTSHEMLFSGLPYRFPYIINRPIGYDYEHSNYEENVSLPDCGIDYKEYDKVFNLINKVDFSEESNSIPRIELFAKLMNVKGKLSNTTTDIPQHSLNECLLFHFNNSMKKKIVMQVDSKGKSRQWFFWEELAKMFSDKYEIVFCSDKKLQFHNGMNLTGKLTLREYTAVISLSELVISCDSSALHIAGVLNKKALGLFGSVNPVLRID